MLLTLPLLLLAVIAPASATATRARLLMGTVCEVTTSDSRAMEAAFAEATRIEHQLLSTWSEESELARLNARGEGEVSPELWQLLASVKRWSEKTGGAFNPLVRPLIDCWQLRGSGAVPDPLTLAAAQARTALSNLSLRSSHVVVLSNGATLEEGAFGKGYALDRMLAAAGDAPDVVLNFGGQLSVKGRAVVTIADPRKRAHAIVQLTLDRSSLSTSSGSEHSFVVGGHRFSHLLDPRTGEALPARGSVSVIARTGVEADILSTALYVMGTAEGLRWANAQAIAALFVDADDSIQVSREFRSVAGQFFLLDPNFHIKE